MTSYLDMAKQASGKEKDITKIAKGNLRALIYIAEDIRLIRLILEREYGQVQLDDLAKKVSRMQQVG